MNSRNEDPEGRVLKVTSPRNQCRGCGWYFNNNNSTCVPAIPVDEPNTLYLLAIGLLLRIFIKHD